MLIWLMGCTGTLPFFGDTEPKLTAEPAIDAYTASPVVRSPLPPPARLLPHVPQDISTWGDETWPPLDALRDGICLGDADWRRAWLEAVDADLADGAAASDLASSWGEMPRPCERPEWCTFVRARLGDTRTADDPMWWHLLADCTSAEDRALLEREDAPAEDIILWYRTRWWGSEAWSPRLAKLLEAAVARADEPAVRDLAGIVANQDVSRSVPFLVDLRKKTRSQLLKDAIAVGLWHSANPTALTLADEACARVSPDDYPQCTWRQDPKFRLSTDPTTDLDGWLRHWGARPWERVQEHPEERDRIVAGLARCVTEEVANEPIGTGTTWTARRCLHDLALLDRASAVALAPGVAGAHLDDPALDELSATLVRFPEGAALERRLRDIGLAPGAVRPSDRPLATVDDVLRFEGRLAEAQFGDDDLGLASSMRALAALAGEPLAGAVFDVVTPPVPATGTDDDDYAAMRVTLHAWHHGTHWRASGDLGPAPMVGLLDAILADEGSELRYVLLADGSIVLAPRASIDLAVRDGLLALPPRSDL